MTPVARYCTTQSPANLTSGTRRVRTSFANRRMRRPMFQDITLHCERPEEIVEHESIWCPVDAGPLASGRGCGTVLDTDPHPNYLAAADLMICQNHLGH